jgi:hypothetical protein
MVGSVYEEKDVFLRRYRYLRICWSHLLWAERLSVYLTLKDFSCFSGVNVVVFRLLEGIRSFSGPFPLFSTFPSNTVGTPGSFGKPS